MNVCPCHRIIKSRIEPVSQGRPIWRLPPDDLGTAAEGGCTCPDGVQTILARPRANQVAPHLLVSDAVAPRAARAAA